MHAKSPLDLSSPADPDHDDAPRGRRPAGLALDPPRPEPTHAPEIEVDRLDPDALKVIYRLRHVGHLAYLVGGCVRDLLLGAKPKDFDVATDAHPGEVRAVFRNCRLIGRRFRLAHVYFRGGKVIEVATFRKNPIDVAEDVPDADDLLITRDNVFGTAEEDALRRDFTVNGLFYDVATGEVIDYVGGREDLQSHRIATIGDPEIRMREDPVRALRAVRFAARLGFTIAPDSFEAMRRHAGELARCAPARVLEEIFKVLRCGGSARAFELLRSSGSLAVILTPLTAALDAWDDARRRSFFAHLAALDRLVRSGEEVSDAVLLGALVMHLGAEVRGRAQGSGRDHPPAPGHPDETGPAPAGGQELLRSLVQTARLPRRVAERTRLALHAQPYFHEPPGRRRRGRRLSGQPYFHDALQLLRIGVEATGEGGEVLERWTAAVHHPERHGHEPRPRAKEVAAEGSAEAAGLAPETSAAPGAEREEVAAAGAEAGVQAGAGAQPNRRKRRRRGGRRRRRRGGDSGTPVEGADEPPPAPAVS